MEQGELQPTRRLQHDIIHGKRYLHSSRRLFHILYRLLFFVQFPSAISDHPPGLIPFIRISRLFHHRDKWTFCQLETGLYIFKKSKNQKAQFSQLNATNMRFIVPKTIQNTRKWLLKKSFQSMSSHPNHPISDGPLKLI